MFAVMPAPLDVSSMSREGLVLKQLPMPDANSQTALSTRWWGSREKANSPSRAKVIYVPEAGRKACVPSTPVCPLQATFDDEKISDVRSSVYSGVRNIANGQMEEEKAIILRSALEDR